MVPVPSVPCPPPPPPFLPPRCMRASGTPTRSLHCGATSRPTPCRPAAALFWRETAGWGGGGRGAKAGTLLSLFVTRKLILLPLSDSLPLFSAAPPPLLLFLPPSHSLLSDLQVVAPRQVADRVMLGLLPSSQGGWPTAVAALKDTGRRQGGKWQAGGRRRMVVGL